MEHTSVDEYLSLVRKRLAGPRRDRAALLSILQENLDAYLFEHPSASVDELIARFGSPEEYGKVFEEEFFLAALDENRGAGRAFIWKKVLLAAVAIIAAAAVAVAGMRAWDLWRSENFRNGYFMETIEGPSDCPSAASDADLY